VLRKIKQDATFDQEKGLRYIRDYLANSPVEHRKTFCYDLSAATDRIPIALQIMLLNYLKPGFGT
jgi:hypothetical protein